MPRTVTKQVFQYDELTPAAQVKARDWFRAMLDQSGDNDFAELFLEEAARIAETLGVTLKTDRDGAPAFYWSGFSSQGDGACFEGEYAAPASPAAPAIIEEFPHEYALHAIAVMLDGLQERYSRRLVADLVHSGRYTNAHSVTIDVFETDEAADDGLGNVSLETEKAVAEQLRRFMGWIYGQLEAAYDGEREDSTVADNIRANEYEFEADGRHTRD